MMRIDFHTAENADVPHVVVFTVGADGLQDTVLFEFFPTPAKSPICRAEESALAFMLGWSACIKHTEDSDA